MSLKLRIPALFVLLVSLGLAYGQGNSEDALLEKQLDRGVGNTDPYSYVLAGKAKDGSGKLLGDAVRFSPDTPGYRFSLARQSFPAFFASVTHALDGLKAYKRNFWWLIGLCGLLSISFLLALTATLCLVLLLKFPPSLPLLSHDVREDWKKAVLAALFAALPVLGPVFAFLGFFFITGLYQKRFNKAVVYVAFLLAALSPLTAKLLNIAFSASSPDMRAIVSVAEGRGNELAIETLAESEDFPARFTYALALKREGRVEEAIAAYEAILDRHAEARVRTNLGNAYVAIGNAVLAKEEYQRALEIKPSATLLYNMSQIYRDGLDFAKGDDYFQQAVALDRDAVSRFTATASRAPNRFVVDETLSGNELWELLKDNKIVSGGILGGRWASSLAESAVFIPALSISLLVLFIVTDTLTGMKARRCSRCGSIFCGKCSRGTKREDICPACYAAMIKTAGEAPKDRVASLLKLHQQQKRTRILITGVSFTLPGIAHIYAGRVLGGAAYLFLFLFSAFAIYLNPIFTTGMGGFAHDWLNWPLGVFAGIIYLIANITIRRRLRLGWL